MSQDVGSQAVDAEDFEDLKDLHVVEVLPGAAFVDTPDVEVGVLLPARATFRHLLQRYHSDVPWHGV